MIDRRARILRKANQIFGSDADAHEWLHSPNADLDDQRPIDMLETDDGAARVDQLLGRIEYGTDRGLAP